MPDVLVVDLSHWNAEPDWPILAKSVSGVILKATQGYLVDPRFVSRVANAHKAGMLIGAYLFATGDLSPQAQVKAFLSVAGDIPLLAVDIEQNDIGHSPTVSQTAEIASLIAQQTNRPPLIYIGKYGPDGRGTGLPNSILSRSPLWVSEYATVDKPNLPAGWQMWTLWQYTNRGTPNGAGGEVDISRWNPAGGDIGEWWKRETGDRYLD